MIIEKASYRCASHSRLATYYTFAGDAAVESIEDRDIPIEALPGIMWN